jgi:hypothetical protein
MRYDPATGQFAASHIVHGATIYTHCTPELRLKAEKWLLNRLRMSREGLDAIISDTRQAYMDGPDRLYGMTVGSITLEEAMAKGKDSLIERFFDFCIYVPLLKIGNLDFSQGSALHCRQSR